MLTILHEPIYALLFKDRGYKYEIVYERAVKKLTFIVFHLSKTNLFSKDEIYKCEIFNSCLLFSEPAVFLFSSRGQETSTDKYLFEKLFIGSGGPRVSYGLVG